MNDVRERLKTVLNRPNVHFIKNKNLFPSKNINLKVREILLRTFIWRILFYESETWVIGITEEKFTSVFGIWCYKQIIKKC